MMNYSKKILLGSFFAMLALAGCSKKNDGTPGGDGYNQPASTKKGLQVSTNATFGSVLTDNNGKTLYFFALDADGNSACNGGCAVQWPVYYSADASDNAGINAADIGVITRADGSKQTTYKGWPLYYFKNDAKAGDTNGDGVGGTWFVGKTDYSIMLVNSQLTGRDTKQYIYNNNTIAEGQGVTQYFTDGNGRTLYAFSPDKANTNTFTKADLSNNAIWPVYEADVKSLPSAINKQLVGQIMVFGKKQLTYNGWPLYYFGSDAKRGDNKGVSVPNPGTWPVLRLTTPAAPAN